MYHLAAVSDLSTGLPSFWATGWLGAQQYLTYNNLRQEADPCGAWIWENQVSWYWEKETTDLKSKEQLFLEAIRTLENQINEPPSMRLKARPGNSGSSVLTCAAFSFYPPELKFRFLRNGLASGSGNCSTGPNGDGSFHAWSLLEVKRGDEHHYQCQVEHEGLAQPLTVDLDSPARSSVPVVGIILGLLLVVVAIAGGVLLWNRMRSGLPAPWLSLSGDDSGDLLPGGNLPPEAEPQGVNAFPATS
nr:IgG receptor FcRn large subunit p51 isoform X4 [Rattus norvegicus]